MSSSTDLRSESLVDLEQVNVILGQASLLEKLGDGESGSDTLQSQSACD